MSCGAADGPEIGERAGQHALQARVGVRCAVLQNDAAGQQADRRAKLGLRGGLAFAAHLLEPCGVAASVRSPLT